MERELHPETHAISIAVDEVEWLTNDGSAPTIGIVGGMGHRSTVAFYSSLLRGFQERWGGRENRCFPAVHIVGVGSAETMSTSGWSQLSAEVGSAVQALIGLGSDLIVTPCNTADSTLRDLPMSPARHVSIVGASIDKCSNVDSELLLLGTRPLVESGVYQEELRHRGKVVHQCSLNLQNVVDEVILQINGGVAGTEVARDLLSALESASLRGMTLLLCCTELSFLLHSILSREWSAIDSLSALVGATLDVLEQWVKK